MSLLSVASSGAAGLRAITLWGAASAAGAAIGPLVGGLLVELTGWQGLFWIDAAIAAACIPLTIATVQESRDPNRPRSIDFEAELPRLPTGKLYKRLLRDKYWGEGVRKI